MDSDLSRLRALFDELIDALPADRARLLAERCGGDTVLKRRVEALLSAAESDEPFLSAPTRAKLAPDSATTAAAGPVTERPGERIGPFKLLQQIGEGGFGVVFMAEQDKPVRRRVAIKVIKLGMDTRQVVARFEQERQALALMDHPHIARVLDAGATESGRPYFAMEYVTGDPITAFADHHKLTIPDRLELFSQVCAAVQHAHTKGVIHRDLKPRNVLVSMTDGKPFAKVIDFGIAKATAAPLTDKALFTEHRQLIGTPEYMSPEQAEGSADIDTRTDVYSLGVLLYELLTGATPFDADRLRSAAWGEMQRIIKEEEPPMPSVRLHKAALTVPGGGGGPDVPSGRSPSSPPTSAQSPVPPASSFPGGGGGTGVPPVTPSLVSIASSRNSDPSRLTTLIKGELDWIVMKALDKDRARRYESPSQLAADVQRHLAGEAVTAAPPSTAYRFRKFVRRNKGKVAACSAVALALLLGIMGTSVALYFADYNAKVATLAQARLEEQAARVTQMFERSLAAVAKSGLDDPALNSLVPIGTLPKEGRPMYLMGYPFDGSDGPLSGLSIQWDRDSDGNLKPTIKGVKQDNSGTAVESPVSEQFNTLALLGTLMDSVLSSAIASRDQLKTANSSLIHDRDAAIETLKQLACGLAQDKLDAGFRPDDGIISWIGFAPSSEQDGPQGVIVRVGKDNSPELVFHKGSPTAVPLQAIEPEQASPNVVTAALRLLIGSAIKERTDYRKEIEAKNASLARQRDIARSALGEMSKALGAPPDELREQGGEVIEALRKDLAQESNQPYSPLPESDRDMVTLARMATAAAKRSVDATNAAEWSAYSAHLALAQSAIASRDYPEARRVLSLTAEKKRGWEFEFLRRLADSIQVVLPGDFSNAWVDDANVYGVESNSTRLRAISRASGRQVDPAPQQLQLATAASQPSWWESHRGPIVDPDTAGRLRLVTNAQLSRWGKHRFSIDHSRIFKLSATSGVQLLDAATGEPMFEFADVGDFFYDSAALVDQNAFLVCWSAEMMGGSHDMRVTVVPLAEMGGPVLVLKKNADLAVATILESALPTISGPSIAVPGSSRRVEQGSDRTIRFFDAESDREVAVFRMRDAITNLRMTSDGARLIISLANGTVEVWDIRAPEERRKDLHAGWIEREPAGLYLDTLWNTDTPDDKLRDAVLTDANLTPLRRLVAVEMLEDRLDDDRLAADSAFGSILAKANEKTEAWKAIDTATIKAALQEGAKNTDLPPRIKALVVARAAAWEYRVPDPTPEQRLTAETNRADLEQATRLFERFMHGDIASPVEQMTDLAEVLRLRERHLKTTDEDLIRARWSLGCVRFVHGDDDPASLVMMREAVSSYETAIDKPTGLLLAMYTNLAGAELACGNYDAAEQIAPKLEQAWQSLGTVHIGCRGPTDIVWTPFLNYYIGSVFIPWCGESEFEKAKHRIRSLRGDVLRQAVLQDVVSTVRYRLSLTPIPHDTMADPFASVQLGLARRLVSLLEAHLAKPECATAAAMSRYALADYNKAIGLLLNANVTPANLAVLAASHHQLNHPSEARAALAQLRAIMADPSAKNPRGEPWSDDPDAKALLAEAEALINPPAPSPQPAPVQPKP